MDRDRTAVITGAASGIGLALAEALEARRYRLVLADIDASGLDRVSSGLPGSYAVTVDVADADAMNELAERTGAPELLCLNAGVRSHDVGAPWESPPEEWQRVLGVNLGGVVNGLRSFVPPMLERGRESSILITASLAGALTWPGGGPYAASKHAVLAVAEQAALALADSNISVTVLCPALVRTAMSESGAEPDDVAELAVDAVTKRRFAVIPHEWSAAMAVRSNLLIVGDQPIIPEPR